MARLAMITARGGSKRIPRKNIKPFLGRPILAYSIEAALRSGCFDEVMVSTEDAEIAKIARSFGASVPFLRSPETANDYATTDQVIAEVLRSYAARGQHFDEFCCIYPTAPFLQSEDLAAAMERLSQHESVMPVCAFSAPPQRGFLIENERLVRAYPKYAPTRSQDLPKLYHDAGLFYACRTDAFFRDETTDTEDMVPVILPDDRVQDIDTPEDWRIAEEKMLLMQRLAADAADPVLPSLADLPTPYYHLDEAKLTKSVRCLKDALALAWGNHRMAYSVKTNALPWLLVRLRKAGFMAEVVSGEEYELARSLGYAPSEIIYNGPIKDRSVFIRILEGGGLVNVDSHAELTWLRELSESGRQSTAGGAMDFIPTDLGEIRVGLRVNCDLRRLCPEDTSASAEASRFGFSYENGELAEVIGLLTSLPGVRLSGLHLHTTTPNRSVLGFERLAEFASRLSQEFSLDLDYVDMGGGYWGGAPDKPDYRQYMPAIARGLAQGFAPERTALIVEPGISLLSSAFTLVSTVQDVRHVRDEVFLITDASRVLLNPQVTRRQYPHHLERRNEGGGVLPHQMVCGYTCMEYDRLFDMENAPALSAGDRIVYDRAGGYTLALVPSFIRYAPAVAVTREDGSVILAREAGNTRQYLEGNHWQSAEAEGSPESL